MGAIRSPSHVEHRANGRTGMNASCAWRRSTCKLRTESKRRRASQKNNVAGAWLLPNKKCCYCYHRSSASMEQLWHNQYEHWSGCGRPRARRAWQVYTWRNSDSQPAANLALTISHGLHAQLNPWVARHHHKARYELQRHMMSASNGIQRSCCGGGACWSIYCQGMPHRLKGGPRVVRLRRRAIPLWHSSLQMGRGARQEKSCRREEEGAQASWAATARSPSHAQESGWAAHGCHLCLLNILVFIEPLSHLTNWPDP